MDKGLIEKGLREKLEQMLEPENLAQTIATMTAITAGYAAAHASPLAPFLVVADVAFVASAGTETALALQQIYLDINDATTEKELLAAAGPVANQLTGKIVDVIVKVVTRVGTKAAGAAAGSAGAKAKSGGLEGHHSDPKFMGGDPNQKLTRLPQKTHRGEGDSLHNDMNDFLRGKTDDLGNHMRPQRGNSGKRIRQNFDRQQRLAALAEFYKQFADVYPDAAKDFFDQHPNLR